MQQLLLNILPAPVPTLDNFVVGENAECLAALHVWRQNPAAETGFYLYGPVGSGKTHLLKASGLHYLDARQSPALAQLQDAQEDLAIDHLDALDEAGQQTVFNLYNRYRAAGRRLLFAAPCSPRNLAIREDVRTRLGYGTIYGLHPLSDQDKAQALEQLAIAQQLSVSRELIHYLIRHTARDMGSLTSLLEALDRFALAQHRPLTLPLLRELLNDRNTA